MLVRGVGVRDIAEIESISTNKVLSVLVNSNHIITPQQQHYDKLGKLTNPEGLNEVNFGHMLAKRKIKFGLFMLIIAIQEKL